MRQVVYHLLSIVIVSIVVETSAQKDFARFEDCGVNAAAPKGIIKSPGYPKSQEEQTVYGDNLECLWRIDLGDPNTLFVVKFMDLVTQFRLTANNDTICYDYINVTTESFGTEQYCGFTKPEDVYLGVGPKLDILFISDRRYGYRGFTLIYSATPDHAPCRDDPCENGECSVQEDRVKFECDCEHGFTGRKCDVDIDECESDPCANGATCEQTEEPGYECWCDEGWQGTHCELIRHPDPCLSNPCRNEGTCTASDDNDQFYCACVPGYTGATCRHDINECDSDPCQNGGTCDNKVNEYECTCGRLYYGDNCENKQKINGCLEEPCSENGDCISTDDEGNYICHCLDGYTGKHCEADFEECSSNPCQNGGLCDDDKEFNRFDCACVGGYKGTFCEIELVTHFTAVPSPSSTEVSSLQHDSTSSNRDPSLTRHALTGGCKYSNTTGDGKCAPPMCKNPGIPFVGEDVKWIEGSVLEFYCVEGYKLEGPESLTCLKNESWSTKMPECVVDRNTTDATPTQSVSPWLGSMIVLSGMFAVTLIAFVTWIMMKGPWEFGSNTTKIMSISQATIATQETSKC